MTLPFIDIDRPYSPNPNYTENIVIESPSFASQGEETPCLSYPTDTPLNSQPKGLTGRLLLKKISRTASIIIKTIAATQQQSKKLQTLQQCLAFAKQGIFASKIIKTVFTISHEHHDMSWNAKAYNWANMMQSLIVGTITLAPLFNSSFTGGKEIVSLCHMIHSGAKLADLAEAPRSSLFNIQEQKKIKLLKICKTILSFIGELFVLIGLVFGVALLPKSILLTLGLVAVILSVAKPFYKQTRAPIDEFAMFP